MYVCYIFLKFECSENPIHQKENQNKNPTTIQKINIWQDHKNDNLNTFQ